MEHQLNNIVNGFEEEPSVASASLRG